MALYRKVTEEQAESSWDKYKKKTKNMERMAKAHFYETWYPDKEPQLVSRTAKTQRELRKAGTSWSKIYKMTSRPTRK